jgi:hypothetical protein
VWTEIIRLLEDPSLIQSELDRRLAAARTADPTKQRERALQHDLTRTRKSIDRLLTAYQEDLLSLDELRRRMPELRQREHAMQAELQAIVSQVSDRAAYLRLAETLAAFLARLRLGGNTRRPRASANRAPSGQGDPGRRRHDYHPSFNPNPAGAVRYRAAERTKLPFAFGASSALPAAIWNRLPLATNRSLFRFGGFH